ncbi:hydrolase [Amycolatopsis keratiniphila subsp. nogabecina]|nr:hydrolase [Amycolatopsis keratiniphila subsp. nogabecina]
MTPHRRRMASLRVLTAAVVLPLGLSTLPASAQPAPPPAEAQDPMSRYQRLGADAAKAEEDFSAAQDDLAVRKATSARAGADLAAANKDLADAEASITKFRGEVDKLVAANFQGASSVNQLAALLDSDSRTDFLQKSAAISLLSGQKADALAGLKTVLDQAAQGRAQAAEAQKRASEATAAAQWAVDQVTDRKNDLDRQIKQVRQALGALPAQDKAKLGKVQDSGSYLGPPGAANDALQAALSKRGSQYEWGATGPAEFDCSGLTSWAYRQAGVDIPRTSRQQYTAGKPVSLDQLQPGDLLFYDDGTGNPGAIHHVGMFVGSGKMVDAPTEGQLVDVRSMKGDGHLMGARRIVG